MSPFKNVDKAKIAFYGSVLAGAFAYGVVVGNREIFPFEQIHFATRSLSQVFDEKQMLTKTKPTEHIFAARYEGNGVITHDPEATAPGLTLMTGFFDGGLEIRVIDSSGTVVNRWPVRTDDIWDNLDHIPPESRPATDWNAALSGVVLLPDGSIVFNHFGLVKLDRCGEVLWVVRRETHHSVEPARNGGFWVGGKRYIRGCSKHPPIEPPYEEDTVLLISADGTVLKEFSVLDLLIENGLRAVLFSNNRTFDPNPEFDVIHLNDVEELTEADAGGFPQFEAGDLLVSIRQPNMVLVFDPDTEVIKWYQVGPWIQQHDADFHADGRITVFDNNYDGTEDGSVFGGSRIIAVDPASGATEVMYGGVDDQPMYTTTQGDHQFLENGNILMAEANAGRVLEVDRDGRVVWEFINRYSDNEVLRISDAIRYERAYFSTDTWACSGGGSE